MSKKEDFVPIPHCTTCTKQCKKYIALFLLEAFESGTASLFCPKYEKIKDPNKESKKKSKKGVAGKNEVW